MGARIRKATNLSLDADLMRDARALGVNGSRAAEGGLRAAVSAARAKAWRAENAKALASANDWVGANGLPPPDRPEPSRFINTGCTARVGQRHAAARVLKP